MARTKQRGDLEQKIQELEEEQTRSDAQLSRVRSREHPLFEFADRMRRIRERNHFTQLVISVVGAQR